MSPISAWTMWCAGRARSQGLLRIDHLLRPVAGHAQGIMLRRVPRYARSIDAMKAANSIVADRKRTKASQMPKIVNLALQGEGGHGAFTWGMLDRRLEEEAL